MASKKDHTVRIDSVWQAPTSKTNQTEYETRSCADARFTVDKPEVQDSDQEAPEFRVQLR